MTQAPDTWLSDFLNQVGAIAGTVHIHQDGGLRLVASVRIPESVRQVVAWVPRGKGMAGLVLERGEAVQTCNLQDDSSGSVRPGAKAVDARAAIAVPVRDEAGWLFAVVGAAFNDARTLDESEVKSITQAAASLRS